MDAELMIFIQYELGEVINWEELCPGVYSLSVQPCLESEYSCGEFYLVLDSAPISQEARALGKPLQGISALLYPINPPDEGAWTAVMYELCKSGVSYSIPALEGWSLTDAALEGMELCPAYFGPFPVPPRTPWGWTLRHRALANGIYWIETSRVETVLAVCYPIWSTEFSDGVTKAGKQLPHTKDDEDLGYLFFDCQSSCTAVFELLKVRPEWLSTGMIRKTELMNAIWEYASMYAVGYNTEEQAGLHDGLGTLLQMLGEDCEPQGSAEHMISLDSDAGTDFIGFWK